MYHMNVGFDSDSSGEARISYLRKVYAWLMVGVLLTSATAWLALSGAPIPMVDHGKTIQVPYLVAMIAEHPFLAGFSFLGFVVMAGVTRKIRGVNALAYFLTTTFTGLFIGPAIFLAHMKAASGDTLSANPVRDTFVLTMCAFGALSAYAVGSKRDFSAWRGFLMTGLFVVIGAMILSIFVGSQSLNLAISSVAVLLFAGFILFDTSKILRGSCDDALGDALNLYLDLVNMFLNLLRILSSSKD
jgi:modulator of FtsH protease